MIALDRRTALTRLRYQRIAPIYDRIEALMEKRYLPWRKRLWSMVVGPSVLEAGVGTGKNMLFYPPQIRVTAIDLTPGMLERAKRRAHELGREVDLCVGDVQKLDFPDDTFDTVLATFVFCSVPEAVLGLKELLRVTKPGGQGLFIEHVRSEHALLGALMDLVNPMVVRMMGANINRRTVLNIQQAGWNVCKAENLGRGDVFKQIVAIKPFNPGASEEGHASYPAKASISQAELHLGEVGFQNNSLKGR